MLKLLRQCRALALTLLLAAPGLGGTWLSLAHPCPVDMPWLAEGPSDHSGQSSHGHGDTSSGSTTSCNCVGAALWQRLGYQFPFLFGPIFIFISLWLTQKIDIPKQRIAGASLPPELRHEAEEEIDADAQLLPLGSGSVVSAEATLALAREDVEG